MLQILGPRDNLKIAQCIICFNPIAMVYLKSIWDIALKKLPHEPVRHADDCNTINGLLDCKIITSVVLGAPFQYRDYARRPASRPTSLLGNPPYISKTVYFQKAVHDRPKNPAFVLVMRSDHFWIRMLIEHGDVLCVGRYVGRLSVPPLAGQLFLTQRQIDIKASLSSFVSAFSSLAADRALSPCGRPDRGRH